MGSRRPVSPVLVLVLVLLVAILGGAYYLLSQNGGLNSLVGGGTPSNGNNNGNQVVNGGAPTAIVITPTPIHLVQVVVAVQELPRGLHIPATGAIDIQLFPADSVPPLAVTIEDPKNPQFTLNKVIGKITRTDIARFSPILYTTIVDDITQVAKIGSDAALVVPPSLRAIAVPVDRLSSTAFALRDGDYVDVIGSFLYTDVDQSFQSRLPNKLTLVTFTQTASGGQWAFIGLPSGRFENAALLGQPLAVAVQPSETQRPRLATQLVIQSALVIHLGTFPLSGDFIGSTPTEIPQPQAAAASSSGSNATQPPTPTPALPDIVTLAVSPQDANVLAWMIDAHVPMIFTLHNPQDLGRTSTQEVTLGFMVQNYGILEPAGLPYALDPPLRSVRSITSSTLVPIDSGAGSGTGG